MEQVTFSYGGVDLYAEVKMETYKDWDIEEIYIDTNTPWPFEHGLYDLVTDEVIKAAHDAVFTAAHEIMARRFGSE